MEVFDSRKVLKNFISLGIAKGGDLLLPLMLVPLLISVLGVELYGVVAIAMACIGLVGIVVEFGFNLTATKRISQNQTKTNVVNKVFADVIAAKLALAFFSSIIYAVLVNFFVSGDDKFIYLTFIFVPFGAAMLPLWLFLGFEKMAAISYINTGAKVLSFVIVWKFVVQPVDAAYVGVAMSIGWLVAGLLGIFVAKYTFKIKFLKPTLNGVWGQLCDGRDVFVSRFFGAMYRDANVIILSLWAGPVIVASYSISEKVVKSVQALQEVVGNVLFPYFSKINLSINARQSSAYRKLLIVSLLMYMLVAGSLSFFANAVVLYFDRNGNELAVEMLTLMSVVIVIGGLNYVVGILGFVASGQTKIFSRSVVIAGVSSLVISFVGCSLWGWHGAVLAFVVSEVVLLISMILMAFYQGRGSVI